MIGAYHWFYIIDVSQKDYTVKEVIQLTGKKSGPSRILLTPEENVAFVSCSNSDFVVAIDLDRRHVMKKILIDHPYFMRLLTD